MKRIIELFLLIAFAMLLTGCLAPVKNEIPLASEDLSVRASNTNETKVVIFNDSNRALFGIDGSGRINVTLDGKGVAQLNIGRYAQIITTKGQHRVDLVHLDLAHFRSQHVMELSNPESFLKIYATPVGNKIELLSVLPPDFEKEFKPVQLSK